MTYKILSTRTTPDGSLFLNTEFNIDDEIHINEIVVSMPTDYQVALQAISNYAASYKWRKDALANLPSVVAAIPLNQETTIE
jgi:hypothetical protein